MYKKPLTVSIVIFFVLMVTTSIIKNKTRTVFVDFETIGEEFTLIEINTNHAFYELVMAPMIDKENEIPKKFRPM